MRAKSKLTKQNSKLSTKLKQIVGTVKLPEKI